MAALRPVDIRYIWGENALTPRGELAAEVWPERAGDQRVAGDLARNLSPQFAAMRSDLYFDGGDLLADSRCVFVTPAVIRRNLQITVLTREELRQKLSAVLHRDVILLDNAPDHHAGMFMMAAGNNTV